CSEAGKPGLADDERFSTNSSRVENRDLLARGLGELLDWFADGSLTAPPVTEYALEDVARAHQDLESAQTVGKLVLRCEE
ncbi:MAG: zinc-binding dehydrogenase, partial [Nannocystaceae bacterium]